MVPRIAGPLNCDTNSFQLEPALCQEEDGKPEARTCLRAETTAGRLSEGVGPGVSLPVWNTSSDANQTQDLGK